MSNIKVGDKVILINDQNRIRAYGTLTRWDLTFPEDPICDVDNVNWSIVNEGESIGVYGLDMSPNLIYASFNKVLNRPNLNFEDGAEWQADLDEDLLEACIDFCIKVDSGLATSKDSYAKMRAAIDKRIKR